MEATGTRELAEFLAPVTGYVIDMDGVLYRGRQPLPHVVEFLGALERRGIPYIMATNNSMSTPADYVDRLARMGIAVAPEHILTSGLATRVWLGERYPRGTKAFVVGMPALVEAILGDGFFQPGQTDADVVVSGLDLTLTYDKLKTAALAIRRGAAYVATNADATLPTEVGLVPGSGAIVAAIRAATDVEPTIIGKPEPGMLIEAARLMGTDPATTVMLGDRLDTDVLAGQRAGFLTLLVLTGVTQPADLERSAIKPDVVVPDLGPLVTYYQTRP